MSGFNIPAARARSFSFGSLGSDAIKRGLFLYLNRIGYKVGGRPSNLDVAAERIQQAGINHDWSMTTRDDNRILISLDTTARLDEAIKQARAGDPLLCHVQSSAPSTPVPRTPAPESRTTEITQLLVGLRQRVDELNELSDQRR
ncbi:hypothetical protein PAPYR_11963 [Paratrimastix pyriformis]|uniref:Uncharacterized protein n=1 Tax=Paratrimastix pyriformis TaxID=342808 RepID=A0ABQ8U6G7_9EUKA|nr:hypothetical protein PAPYR_11963 [Paratrimastix pyriformis]